MSALTFTTGRFYKTRDGRHKIEVIVAGRNFACGHSIMGLRTSDVGVHIPSTFTGDGRLYKDSESPADLIAEWMDKPEVDWSKMPAWAVAVSMDESGKWYHYSQIPTAGAFAWTVVEICGRIPEAYCPKWSGDWRDSLVTRPTEGGK